MVSCNLLVELPRLIIVGFKNLCGFYLMLSFVIFFFLRKKESKASFTARDSIVWRFFRTNKFNLPLLPAEFVCALMATSTFI